MLQLYVVELNLKAYSLVPDQWTPYSYFHGRKWAFLFKMNPLEKYTKHRPQWPICCFIASWKKALWNRKRNERKALLADPEPPHSAGQDMFSAFHAASALAEPEVKVLLTKKANSRMFLVSASTCTEPRKTHLNSFPYFGNRLLEDVYIRFRKSAASWKWLSWKLASCSP